MSELIIYSGARNIENKKNDETVEPLNTNPEEHEPKESLLKKIFGSSLNLSEEGLSCRKKVQRILNSNYFHVSVIILVLLDTICVARY